MKTFGVKCRLYHYELTRIPVKHIEQEVKERLARELADKLIEEIDWEESINMFDMTKEITASVIVITEAEWKEYQEIKKAVKTLKGVM
jgi:hypothetical protein